MSPPVIVGQADKANGLAQVRVALPGPVHQAWQALTTAEHTIRWLGRLEGASMTRGSHFRLWHDEQVCSHHTVLQWEPPRLLSWTWNFPDEPPSSVVFALAQAGDSSATLTVRHEGLEAPVPYAAGWHRHLQYLDAHLRGRELQADDFWTGYDELVAHYGA